jgi:hypothetical protein
MAKKRGSSACKMVRVSCHLSLSCTDHVADPNALIQFML